MTAGAIASQFSASVADSIGASGLVKTTTHGHISSNHAYPVIGAVAVCVIRATDVVSIATLASRAFVLFYALQCLVAVLVAVLVARHKGARRKEKWFGFPAVVAFAIAIPGIPARG